MSILLMWSAGLFCLLAVLPPLSDQEPTFAGPAGLELPLQLPPPAMPPLAAPDNPSPSGALFDQHLSATEPLPGDVMLYSEDAFIYAQDALDAPLPSLPATQVTAAHLPKFSPDGFGITSLDLRHTLLMGYNELPPLNLTPGAAIHHWSSPATLDLPSRVYDVYLDLFMQPWESDTGAIVLGFTPGLYGDFESIDRNTFQWSGWLVGRRHIGPRWTLVGGVAYLRQLRNNWLPIGGAIWNPSERTQVDLLFPRPKVAHRLSSDGNWTSWGYVAGQFGGGAWSVADTPETNVLLGYSDLRLLAGWEAFSLSGYECRAELGYVFARDISVNTTSVQTPSDSLIAQFMFAF